MPCLEALPRFRRTAAAATTARAAVATAAAATAAATRLRRTPAVSIY